MGLRLKMVCKRVCVCVHVLMCVSLCFPFFPIILSDLSYKLCPFFWSVLHSWCCPSSSVWRQTAVRSVSRVIFAEMRGNKVLPCESTNGRCVGKLLLTFSTAANSCWLPQSVSTIVWKALFLHLLLSRNGGSAEDVILLSAARYGKHEMWQL